MTSERPYLIRNAWRPQDGGSIVVARILDHRTAPEGFDVERVRFVGGGAVELDPEVGHIVSLLSGGVTLDSNTQDTAELTLSTTSHSFIPVGWHARINAQAGAEFLIVSGGTPDQARGKRLLVRDEAFLAACAMGTEPLRWILTQQYLSRRVFLEHDQTLVSKAGRPVSWYRTTMFEVAGLPTNDEGQSVFKMQYDSRTEFNVCYDVRGRAQVRMAHHPYREVGQSWGPWLALDGDSTYHANETPDSHGGDRGIASASGEGHVLRNKHEVLIEDGHATLFCLFDPAPAGFERHTPGIYSDYEPLESVLGTERHAAYRRHLVPFDEMVDELSLALCRGDLDLFRGSSSWRRFVRGRRAQTDHDIALLELLAREGEGRDHVVAPWALPHRRPAGGSDALTVLPGRPVTYSAHWW